MKDVPFRQTTKNGCGSIALANYFNDARYMDGIEQLTAGESDKNLNDKLQKFHPGFWLEVVVRLHSVMHVQNRFLDESLFIMEFTDEEMEREFKDAICQPMIVIIKSRLLNHAILVVRNFKDSKFYIVDGRMGKIVPLSLNTLLTSYHVVSISYFCCDEVQDNHKTLFMYKSQLPHIFSPGE